MNGISLLVVWAALGVVYSWRTGVDGQQEYVLQVEPEILQSLAAGEEILSEVPAEAGHLQRLCITVLPKGGTPAAHTQLAEDRFRQLAISTGRYASSDPALASDAQPTIIWPSRANPEQTYGINVGWQPDVKGSLQYFVQIDSTLLRTLAVGDEIYVPVDPAAGRPARFIVKSGKELLPKIGGLQTQLTQGAAPGAPASSNPRGRFPAATDGGANSWSNWSSNPSGGLAADYSRPTRPGDSLPNSAAEARGNSLWSSGGNSYAPAGTTLNPPSTAFNDYANGSQSGSQYPSAMPAVADGRAYGSAQPSTTSNFDKYRNPNSPAYDAANSTLYPPAGNSQPLATPQISRNTTQPPFDTRLAGGTTVPNGMNVLGATGILPPTGQAPLPDKPWGPLLFVSFALFFSIGGNLYLAYTALEFHSRYRNAIERLRSAARSA